MCGIVGYAGDRDMQTVLMVGLERLSYRGYDSAGIAIISHGELSSWRKPGKLFELDSMIRNLSLKGSVGIGHTRWATHGRPNEVNAHPHMSQECKVAIVHNGIIENYYEIKTRLIKDGVIFRSETDSEVIAHLIQTYMDGNLMVAVEKAIGELEGTYAIAVVSEYEPDKIVVARKGSPLVIGLGKDENFVASDINAVMPHTKDVIYLEDDEIGYITRSDYMVKKCGGESVVKEVHSIQWDPIAAEKGGYEHFMLKEIHEQPAVVRKLISQLVVKDKIVLSHLRLSNDFLAKVQRFIIQACGTSWHAGLYAKYLIEKYGNVLTEVDISSEFRYRQMITQANEVMIALSQSGETADTLASLREAKSKFFKVLSFVNVRNSSIDRESDAVIYTHAGPEVGVASTKNYVAQLSTIYLFVVYMALLKKRMTKKQAMLMMNELNKVPDYLESILSQEKTIRIIAQKYYMSEEFLFIGRGVNYPTALEGALKLKEISYIHATGYPAGELKHGPIALIDSKLPVVCIIPKAETYEKMFSNIQEVKARKGKTIIIATEGDTRIKEYADDIIYIPQVSEELSPILAVVPLQLLAYHIAIMLDCDVDQPRNLAKSVTVE